MANYILEQLLTDSGESTPFFDPTLNTGYNTTKGQTGGGVTYSDPQHAEYFSYTPYWNRTMQQLCRKRKRGSANISLVLTDMEQETHYLKETDGTSYMAS